MAAWSNSLLRFYVICSRNSTGAGEAGAAGTTGGNGAGEAASEFGGTGGGEIDTFGF